MSGFDMHWLALREPVDRRSRDPVLQDLVTQFLDEAAAPAIVDIGCGTGSTYRALQPQLCKTATWTLFDHDDRLLTEARRRHPQAGITFVRGDLNDISSLPLIGATLVTASALFDLCSPAFTDRFVDELRQKGMGLYAALNYDGDMHWSLGHPLDRSVRDAFNAHQLGDKGFGPSAGPQAWRHLGRRLEEHGYDVMVAASPWRMGEGDAELQHLFLDGIFEALAGGPLLSMDDLREWYAFRLGAVSAPESSCVVGHRDVLALL